MHIFRDGDRKPVERKKLNENFAETLAVTSSGLLSGGAALTPLTAAMSRGGMGVGNPLGTGLVIIGDSISAQGYGQVGTSFRYRNHGWWCHALNILGWPLEVKNMAAVSGRTAQDILAGFDAEVTPHLPAWVFGIVGQNNLGDADGGAAAITLGTTTVKAAITLRQGSSAPTNLQYVSLIIECLNSVPADIGGVMGMADSAYKCGFFPVGESRIETPTIVVPVGTVTLRATLRVAFAAGVAGGEIDATDFEMVIS